MKDHSRTGRSRRATVICLIWILSLAAASCGGTKQADASVIPADISSAAAPQESSKAAESQAADPVMPTADSSAETSGAAEISEASSEPEESVPEEPAALLNDAADAVWVNETVYDFRNVAPLWAADFSDLSGKYMEGSAALIRQEAATANRVDMYELSVESYSPIDEYYLYMPADSDVWRFFYMPTLSASGDAGWDGEAFSVTGTVPPYLSGADGISYGNSPAGRDAPWDLLVFGSRNTAGPALVYDEEAGTAYLYVQSQMGDCAMRRLEAGVLHKPYRANIGCKVVHDALPEDTDGLLLWQSVDTTGGYYPQGTVYTEEPYVKSLNKSSGKVVFIGTDAKPLTFSRDYTDAGSFSFGYAAVEADGKWGYIDESGREVLPCEFDPAPDHGYFLKMDHGVLYNPCPYPSTDGTAVVFKDGQCGLYAMDGTLLIGFGVFENMAPAYENRLWVQTAEGWRLLDLAALKALL